MSLGENKEEDDKNQELPTVSVWVCVGLCCMLLSHSKTEEKTIGAGDTRKNPKDQSLQKVTVGKANPNVGGRRLLFPFACRETQKRNPPSVSIKPRLPKHGSLPLWPTTYTFGFYFTPKYPSLSAELNFDQKKKKSAELNPPRLKYLT